jgi:hypothetical protein
MTSILTAAGCPLALAECPRSIARPPALRMNEPAAVKIAMLADKWRRDGVDRRLTDELSDLVDRLRGKEKPRRMQIRRMIVKGREIQVQHRGHFGL